MKIKIPSKTIEVCDICEKQSSAGFENCLVCNKQFCWTCRAILVGCMLSPLVCKKCGDREDVIEIVKIYARDFLAFDIARSKALKNLSKKQ